MVTIKKTEFKELYDLACSDWKTKLDAKFAKFLFSDSLELEESFLGEMKAACDAKQLKVFCKIFKSFVNQKDLFTIKTYFAVCKELKEKELVLSNFSFLPKEYQEKALAQAQIQQIEKLFNGAWIKDWSNSNQRKYYPYYEFSNKGFSFGYSYFDYSICQVAWFKDEETSDFVGKTFISIYKKVL